MNVAHERPDYHAAAPSVFGSPLAALLVVGLVSAGPLAGSSLIAWLDLSGAAGRDMRMFSFALDIERSYADNLLSFPRHDTPPRYCSGIEPDRQKMAQLFDIDRVVCAVCMTESGQVVGVRDYESLDLLYVEQTAEEIARLNEVVERSMLPSVRGQA